MTTDQRPTRTKKPANPLVIGLCFAAAAAGLYIIGAVLLIVDGTTMGLFDAAPESVKATIKFAYEPFFKAIE